MKEKIKTSYLLTGYTLDGIDKRSDEYSRRKSEQIESDLSLLWGILENGFVDVKNTLSKEEVLVVTKALRGKKIYGEDMVIWAKVGLISEIEKSFAFFSTPEKQKVNGKELIEKIQSMSIIARISLCDWASRFWAMRNGQRLVEEW